MRTNPDTVDQPAGVFPPLSVEISNVHKTFRRKEMTIRALDDVSLSISGGEFISLIGPSGCGKSTLLKAIAGLHQPSQGTINVAGQPVSEPLTDAGLAFQKPTLLPWLTIQENIGLPFKIRGLLSRQEREDRISELLEITGLTDFRNHYPRELSGGMEQRAAICRSLVLRPGILLMDEPFGALDEFTREDLNEELLRIWQTEPKTVIFVTHSIAEAVFLSDRIVVMSARPGRVFDVLDVDLPRPRKRETRFTAEYTETVTRARRVLDAAQNESK